MDLSGCVVEEKSLKTERQGDNYLGPDVRLSKCSLEINCAAKRLTITRTTFDSCSIKTSRPLNNYRFHGADFIDCIFEGSYLGCMFGSYANENRPTGRVERCDFSKAVLHLSSFLRVDREHVTLPSWPHFSMIAPFGEGKRIRSLSWPASLDLLMKDVVAVLPKDVSFCVLNATHVVKEFGGTLDEVRQCLSRLDRSVTIT